MTAATASELRAAYLDVPRRPRPDRPWVLANFVVGLDGAVTIDGRVGPLNTPADKVVFQLLREVADVVLVGAGTVRAEHYGPVRLDEHARQRRSSAGKPPTPGLAIVSGRLDLDPGDRVFTEASPDAPTVVITSADADPARLSDLREVAEVIEAGAGEVDLHAALRALAERGVEVVTCEGGPALHARLQEADLVDELCLTIAPLFAGDDTRLLGEGGPPKAQRRSLAHALEGEGGEVFLRYLASDPGA